MNENLISLGSSSDEFRQHDINGIQLHIRWNYKNRFVCAYCKKYEDTFDQYELLYNGKHKSINQITYCCSLTCLHLMKEKVVNQVMEANSK